MYGSRLRFHTAAPGSVRIEVAKHAPLQQVVELLLLARRSSHLRSVRGVRSWLRRKSKSGLQLRSLRRAIDQHDALSNGASVSGFLRRRFCLMSWVRECLQELADQCLLVGKPLGHLTGEMQQADVGA